MRQLRVRPLSMVAAGLVVVALDLRTRAGDFLPDVAGWLLVGSGAWMAGIGIAAVVAGVAAVLSLSELTLPYTLVAFDARTGVYLPAETPGAEGLPLVQRWDDLSALHGGVIAAAAVVGAIAVALLLHALARRADQERDPASARHLRLALLAPLLWAAPIAIAATAAALSDGAYDPVWNEEAESPALVGLLALVAVATLLVLRRDRGWAIRPGSEARSPWSERHG